jgi:hypothetical protein
VKRLLRLSLLVGLAIWAWRTFVGGRRASERATAAYADGSSIVLEPDSEAFQRLASVARSVLAR